MHFDPTPSMIHSVGVGPTRAITIGPWASTSPNLNNPKYILVTPGIYVFLFSFHTIDTLLLNSLIDTPGEKQGTFRFRQHPDQESKVIMFWQNVLRLVALLLRFLSSFIIPSYPRSYHTVGTG